ncbi:MAG: hypothetical protein ACRCXZ_09840, partial [Patescibacteria group bacterium]
MSDFSSSVVCKELIIAFESMLKVKGLIPRQSKMLEGWTNPNPQYVDYILNSPYTELGEIESRAGVGNAGVEIVNSFLIEKGMTNALIQGPVDEDSLVAGVLFHILNKWICPGFMFHTNIAEPIEWKTQGVDFQSDSKKRAYAKLQGAVYQSEDQSLFAVGILKSEDQVIFETHSVGLSQIDREIYGS